MTAPMYGREALHRLREQQAAAQEPERQASLLEEIPADAPMVDATLTAWNGERFVDYDKWLATAPLARGVPPETGARDIPASAASVTADCGGTRVWLVRDGDRWAMFAGARKASSRRRDFASPFLAHAIRTAEQWYGVPAGGWRAEGGRNGSGAEPENTEHAK